MANSPRYIKMAEAKIEILFGIADAIVGRS
jgi:hypothetical protein